MKVIARVPSYIYIYMKYEHQVGGTRSTSDSWPNRQKRKRCEECKHIKKKREWTSFVFNRGFQFTSVARRKGIKIRVELGPWPTFPSIVWHLARHSPLLFILNWRRKGVCLKPFSKNSFLFFKIYISNKKKCLINIVFSRTYISFFLFVF